MTTRDTQHPILVTGAAGAVGGIGRNLTELLLARGHKVRALVRREDARAEALRQLGAEVVQGVVVGQWPSQDGHYPVAAYQAAFGFIVALQSSAFVWFAMPWIRSFGKSLWRPFARPPKARGISAASGRPVFERPIFQACDGVDW